MKSVMILITVLAITIYALSTFYHRQPGIVMTDRCAAEPRPLQFSCAVADAATEALARSEAKRAAAR